MPGSNIAARECPAPPGRRSVHVRPSKPRRAGTPWEAGRRGIVLEHPVGYPANIACALRRRLPPGEDAEPSSGPRPQRMQSRSDRHQTENDERHKRGMNHQTTSASQTRPKHRIPPRFRTPMGTVPTTLRASVGTGATGARTRHDQIAERGQTRFGPRKIQGRSGARGRWAASNQALSRDLLAPRARPRPWRETWIVGSVPGAVLASCARNGELRPPALACKVHRAAASPRPGRLPSRKWASIPPTRQGRVRANWRQIIATATRALASAEASGRAGEQSPTAGSWSFSRAVRAGGPPGRGRPRRLEVIERQVGNPAASDRAGLMAHDARPRLFPALVGTSRRQRRHEVLEADDDRGGSGSAGSRESLESRLRQSGRAW